MLDTGANRIIKIEDYTVSNPETGRKKSIPPISNILPTGITFPSLLLFLLHLVEASLYLVLLFLEVVPQPLQLLLVTLLSWL
jgi:hypothetical protein